MSSFFSSRCSFLLVTRSMFAFILLVLSMSASILFVSAAVSDVDTTGFVDAADYTEGTAKFLSNDISGNADNCLLATLADALLCADCIGGTEIVETGLTGTASGLNVGDLSCSNCVGTTEIEDLYLSSLGDTASGDYTFLNTYENPFLFIDSVNNKVLVGASSSSLTDYKLYVSGSFLTGSSGIYLNDSDSGTELGMWRLIPDADTLRFERRNHTAVFDWATSYAPLILGSDGSVSFGGGPIASSPASEAPLSETTLFVASNNSGVGIRTREPKAFLDLVGNNYTPDGGAEMESFDTAIQFESETQNWTFGLDGSEYNIFKFSAGSGPGSGDVFALNETGSAALGTTSLQDRFRVSNGSIRQTPITPKEIATLTDNSALDYAVALDVEGDFAYVGNWDNDSLTVVDVSIPTAPKVVGRVEDNTYLTQIIAVDVVGDYAYTMNSNRFVVIDVSDKTNPFIRGTTNEGTGNTRDVHAVGSYVYGIENNAELHVFDVRDPDNPMRVGYLYTLELEAAYALDVQGDFAYVACAGTNASIAIVNISDPENPELVSELINTTLLNNAAGIEVVGTYAYVTGSVNDNLVIVNVSDPASPNIVGYVVSSTHLDTAAVVKVAGRYAYVVGTSGVFAAVDISDPTDPFVASSSIDLGYSRYLGMDVQGRYAYATDYTNNQLSVIDLGTTELHAASIGIVGSTNLHVTDDLIVDGNMHARSGAAVGQGGLHVEGDLRVARHNSLGNYSVVATGVAKTMYMATTTRAANHNCDDNPADCCIGGYHMCTALEFLEGGRRVVSPSAGIGNPYNAFGDVDPAADSVSVDCDDWTSNSGSYKRFECRYNTVVECYNTYHDCSNSTTARVWCCED